MTGNNGFRVPDPFERSYGGAAPWEQEDPPECDDCLGTGLCRACDGRGCDECEGSGECHACNGEGRV